MERGYGVRERCSAGCTSASKWRLSSHVAIYCFIYWREYRFWYALRGAGCKTLGIPGGIERFRNIVNILSGRPGRSAASRAATVRPRVGCQKKKRNRLHRHAWTGDAIPRTLSKSPRRQTRPWPGRQSIPGCRERGPPIAAWVDVRYGVPCILSRSHKSWG